MSRMMFVAGVAVGYVLGTRAGRERYEQIVATAQKIRQNPTVQNFAGMAKDRAEQVGAKCREQLGMSGNGSRPRHPATDRPHSGSWEMAGANHGGGPMPRP